MKTRDPSSNFLRRALQANAVFSAGSGVTLAVAARPLAELLGIDPPRVGVVLGLGLVLFAAGLLRNSLRETLNRSEAVVTVILDAGWVLGSAALIYAGVLTTAGNWAVAIVADIVLIFGLLQLFGIRKLAVGEPEVCRSGRSV